MPRRSTPQPRYIKAETVCIGDTIKVTYPATEQNDIARSYIGTVASRNRLPPFVTEYNTAKDQVLFSHVIGEKPTYRITLLDRTELTDTTAQLDLDIA